MLRDKVTIQVSRSADGTGQYLQVMSGDMVSLNVVIVAKEFVIRDDRKKV